MVQIPPERDDIAKVIRVTKDGTKAQVRLKNNRLDWIMTDQLPDGMRQNTGVVYVDMAGKVQNDTSGQYTGEVKVNREEFMRPETGVVREVPIKNTPVASPAPVKKSGFKVPDVHIPDTFKIKGGRLTDAEASRYGPDFPAAFDEICLLMDKLISHTTKGHPKVLIWADIDEADTQILVDMFLALGKTDPKVAVFVRASVTFYRQARIIEILAPRFMKTWENYMMFGFEMPGNRAFRQRVRQSQRR